MNQHNTEREQRFIDLAAELADDFAGRAAQHDEEASFPYENYARLRETGYTHPDHSRGTGRAGREPAGAHQGAGASGPGRGATALAINMHFNTMGLLIDLYHSSKLANVEAKLRKIAAERLICGGSGSEPDNAIYSSAPAHHRAPRGRRIHRERAQDFRHPERRDRLSFSPRRSGRMRPQGPTILTFFIQPTDTPGLAFKDDWNVMGMRATASRSSELKDAFVARRRRGGRDTGSDGPLRVTKMFRQGPVFDRRALHRYCGGGAQFRGRLHARPPALSAQGSDEPPAQRLQQGGRDGHADRGRARRDVEGGGAKWTLTNPSSGRARRWPRA